MSAADSKSGGTAVTAAAAAGSTTALSRPVTISFAWLKLYLIELVRQIGAKYGWEEHESLDTDIIWSNFRNLEWISALMKPGQRINHFPKMSACCEKGMTARLLNAQRTLFPAEYDFYPKSWEIRSDADLALMKSDYDSSKTYIIKPVDESHGSNIVLAQTWDQITKQFCRDIAVQEYIANPLLIDGFKFDFRVYVLVQSVNPLRAVLFHDGLARLCTQKYHKPTPENLDKVYMHLTNYDLNKTNSDFEIPDPTQESETGSKRALAVALKQIAKRFPNSFSESQFWTRLESVISKTLLSFWPIVVGGTKARFPQSNDMCFQLLGFDILLDEQFNPYLLEVNQSPSIAAETALDMRLKQKLLETIFTILGYLPPEPAQRAALEAKAAARSKPSITITRAPPKAGDPPHFDVAAGEQQFSYGTVYPSDSDDAKSRGTKRLDVLGAANPIFFAAFERFRTAGAEGLTRDQFLALCAAYGIVQDSKSAAPAAVAAAGDQKSSFPVLSALAAGALYDSALSTLTDRLARAPTIDKDKEKRKKDELAAAKKSVIGTPQSKAANVTSAAAAAAAPPAETNKLVAFIQKLGDAQDAEATAAAAASVSTATTATAATAATAAGGTLPRSAFATPKDYSTYLYNKHFGTPAPAVAAAAGTAAATAGGFEFHLSKTTHGIDGKVMPFVLFAETIVRYVATSAGTATAALRGTALVDRFAALCVQWKAHHK